MDEQQLMTIAGQLRKPEGETGVKVGEMMNHGNAHINRNTIEALAPQPGETILEIGMGNGFFIKDILSQHPSLKYIGCDYSDVMVEQALKLNESFVTEGRAIFFHATASDLPLEKGTCDKVFTVNTVYFWDDAGMVLAEIFRVLKPGGSLLIAVRPKSLMQHYPFVKYGFRMFSAQELSDLLETNRFKVEKVIEKQEPPQEVNGLSMNVETLVVCASKV